jgi:acetyl-CoA carboxylase biotin carboxyl carrier protein
MQFSLDTVRDVAHLLRDTGLHEISIENTDEGSGEPFRVTVRRNATSQRQRARSEVSATVATPPHASGGNEEAITATGDAITPSETAHTATVTVTSTAVGLFRASRPALKIGDSVVIGQVVGVVESMKIPNEILAPINGRIVELQVEDNQGVEYGQPLLTIEPGTV